MEEYTPKNPDAENEFTIDQEDATQEVIVEGPKHAKKSNKLIYYIIMAVCLVVMVGAIVYLCWPSLFDSGKPASQNEGFKTPSTPTETVETELPINPIDFKKLQEQYPDACAWIQVDGIPESDYPIFMSQPEVDDNYYLDHNRDGESDRYGEIYIQKLNYKNFSDPNTLIYGHNMSNGDMFGTLYDGSGKQFDNQEFFDAHRKIYIYTPGHILEYEIISAFVYDNRHILNSFNFDIEQEREQFFNECTNPTAITKKVVEGAELNYMTDKIITLSTCTGNDTTRYLVVGKLISDTETQ